jgi:hypothetical protein
MSRPKLYKISGKEYSLSDLAVINGVSRQAMSARVLKITKTVKDNLAKEGLSEDSEEGKLRLLRAIKGMLLSKSMQGKRTDLTYR